MDEKKYLKRKDKARSDGNRKQLAESCKKLGDYYYLEGQYVKAVKEYQEEADLYAKLGMKLEMATAHRMIGDVSMLLCNFNKALEHVRVYLKIAKSLHNKVEEQRAYATLGRAHLLYAQHSETASKTSEQLKLAEKSFLKSLLLIKDITGQIKKLDCLDMQARCYLNIGVVKEHMEDFKESIAYIDRAIRICESNDLFELTHLCYISMSLLYHCKKNDATRALRFCNLALQLAKRLPDKVHKICETLTTKAEILIKAGDFASAKQILTKAYKKNSPNVNDRATIEKMLRVVVVICRTLDELVTTSSVDYGKCKKLYERLGDGCCSLNNYVKALEYYQQALTCAEKNGDCGKALMPIYVSLYETYKDIHEYEKALQFLWKEYEINKDEPAEAFFTLCNIAQICEQQNQSFWTIQDVYQKAKAHVDLMSDTGARKKLYKTVFMHLKRLQEKHKMHTMIELLEQEAAKNGINLNDCTDDDDNESETLEQNTPELGDDICLDDLTDSDTSDLDETDKHREHRATRGKRGLTIKRNKKGETQLHQACIAGNLELVRRLLDQGHTVNVRDHAGWLPLHEACNYGYRDIVELLLERGAAVAINDKGGTSCDGITPLYDACTNGLLDVVEVLLQRGADATVKTDDGDTCLNALDKWRRNVTLTTGLQAHYHQVRTTLLRPLVKAGIVGKSTTGRAPLENTSDGDVREAALIPESDENSSDSIGSSTCSRAASCQRVYSRNGRILKDTNNPKKPAGETEYRKIMEQLKHPHRMRDEECIPSSSGSSGSGSKQKRNAYLGCEEVDDDDWLIDDLGPEKKKQRFLTTPTKQGLPHYRTSKPITPTKATSPHESLSISKENLYDSNYSSGLCDTGLGSNTDLDAFQTLQDASNVTHGNKSSTFSKSRSLSIGSTSTGSASNQIPARRSKHKQQASLLDSGFIRFRSESPSSLGGESNGGFVNLYTGAEPDSPTTTAAAATSMHLVISPAKTSSPIQLHTSSQLVPAAISFKIKVEDELLLVPIDRKRLSDINIRWLAEEASRRYYNSTGLKPLLRLKTADGFAYEETDPVSIAVEQNMLIATVLEWTIAPLGQRYEEMCHQMKKEIDIDVQRSLERAQASNSLELDNFWLNAPASEPVFRALFHQTQLRVLDLSNNFLQNDGCRQLAKAIGTLKQLKSLNLSGNFITSTGLAVLLLSNTQNVTQPIELDLEELNVSRNPLGNECLRILDKFCNKQNSSLEKLLMAQCGLTNLYDYDLCYFQLTSFDVSFNQIQTVSRQRLLTKLNSCRMQCLNLSYTHAENDFQSRDAADDIVRFFESGTCEKLKRLSLCGCHIGDAQLYRISKCLKNANALELLDLAGNALLSPYALQYILEEMPQLRKLIATNCTRFVDQERIQKLAQAKQIPNLLCLTLGECDDTDDVATVAGTHDACSPDGGMYGELCKIWRAFWSDKAKSVAYGRHLVLYTNDKDLV